MSEDAQNLPFKTLGLRLKVLRQHLQESVAEVAGAVEIDEALMSRIEQGSERPSEDILMLLINHFDMHEDEASKLWLLAGYDKPETERAEQPLDDLANRNVVVMMTMDSRILYSDSVHINANPKGIIMNFLQPGAPTGSQRVPVARVGMSYEEAYSLLDTLGQTLEKAKSARQPKHLPAPKPEQESKSNPESDKKNTN